VKPSRQFLKKREILRGYQSFSRLIAEGQSLQRGAVRCFFNKEAHGRGALNVGFSVSRSVRNAVERNRARRWMREAYRRNKEIFTGSVTSTSQNVNLVFMMRVRGRLARDSNSRRSIEQAVIFLLKELQHHLFEKP
jgi:ribonuclease P protein component